MTDSKVGLLAGVTILLACAAFLSRTQAESEPCSFSTSHVSTPGLSVVYVKSAHTVCLLDSGLAVWSARASHGRSSGKKHLEGDGRTPEGRYTLSPARPSSKFGRFMALSYPNADDRAWANAEGKSPGGAVGIHGPQAWYAFLGRWQSLVNHSDGCIVLDAPAMQALVARVKKPVPITIAP